MTEQLSRVALVVVLGLLSAVGCGPNQAPPTTGDAGAGGETEAIDPHDVPITEEQMAALRAEAAQFGAAVAKVKAFRDEIEQETAAGIPAGPFKVHQALDKADLLLQWLPEIARDSGVAKQHWEAVNTAANELRTQFEEVHQNIDEKKAPDFAAVADQIDQAIGGLEGVAAQATEAGGEG